MDPCESCWTGQVRHRLGSTSWERVPDVWLGRQPGEHDTARSNNTQLMRGLRGSCICLSRGTLGQRQTLPEGVACPVAGAVAQSPPSPSSPASSLSSSGSSSMILAAPSALPGIADRRSIRRVRRRRSRRSRASSPSATANWAVSDSTSGGSSSTGSFGWGSSSGSGPGSAPGSSSVVLMSLARSMIAENLVLDAAERLGW